MWSNGVGRNREIDKEHDEDWIEEWLGQGEIWKRGRKKHGSSRDGVL